MVLPLSDTESLTVYETGNWGRYLENPDAQRNSGELTDPDTKILVTSGRKVLFRYSLKDLPSAREADAGAELVLAAAVHECSPSLDVTYLILQAGNQGGWYVALRKSAAGYGLITVADAGQGRLVVDMNRPGEVEVWSAADSGACTACPKPFVVRRFKFNGHRFQFISKYTTKRSYSGFQDKPLVIKR
jgi:hypothetical protein